MTTPDLLTIIMGGCVLLPAVITPMLSALFRRPKVIEMEGTPDRKPSFSIVLTVCDDAEKLERNLPAFLDQQYDDFEVIVVNELKGGESDDILKRMMAEHPHLYTTFIPESSHYLSRRKLALTIGVKASKNEWIIITDIDCRPHSAQWLTALSRYCDDADLLCGYTDYSSDGEEAPAFWRYERLLDNCHLLRHPFRYEGNNLAFRKQLFMEHNGFLKNLRYLRGEYDFLVNEYGATARVAVVTESDARMAQDVPTQASWTNKHLYYMETRKHLQRATLPRLLFNADQAALHLNYLLQLGVMAYGGLTLNLPLSGAALLALVLTLALRIGIGSRACRDYAVSLPLWRLPLMELRVVWQNLYRILRHKFSSKYDYIRR